MTNISITDTVVPAQRRGRSRGRWRWWVPVGLVALSLVPEVAGLLRVGELASGGPRTASNDRFFAEPLPVVLHVVGITVFCLLGAFQFAPALRGRRWHRVSGRLVIPAGVVVAVTGMWMTVSYDLPPSDDAALNVIRLVVGAAMTVFLVLGYVAARRRRFMAHRRWVTRGYALGMGAGTQLFTNLPFTLTVGAPSGLSKTALMVAGWAINVAVAEYLLRRRPRPAARPASAV